MRSFNVDCSSQLLITAFHILFILSMSVETKPELADKLSIVDEKDNVVLQFESVGQVSKNYC